MRFAPNEWERWLERSYQKNLNATECLFISCVALDERCNPEIIMKAIEKAFEEESNLKNILFATHKDKNFTQMTFLKYFTAIKHVFSHENILYCIERSTVLPSIVLREGT